MTTPALPPDRGHLSTERRNDATRGLDTLDVRGALELLNDQDAAVPAAVRRAIPALTPLVEAVVAAFRAGGRLIYLGAGTSGRLAVLDASECPPTFHTDPGMVVGLIAAGDKALRQSSEGAEDDPDGARAELERLEVGPRDVVVGIAAGGTTPYVWGALRIAKARGATTGLIVCVELAGVREDRACLDHAVELLVGPEPLTGSTRMKAGTATKLALNMITTTAMVRVGKVWGNLMVDVRASNSKLVDRATRILMGQTDLSRADAAALLEKAGGKVKLALIMAHRGVDAAEAQKLLDATQGQLRPILGPPR
ncbi:MAG: N-acetylmuramic acid 6-phosphate etherase [Planctomycetota bacterium]|nr:N-acetylmuramic acid 6-phosphate etherase [Planctomycetota bacterium]